MKEIPYEIIKNITQSLDIKEQYKCLTLCKTWYKVVLDSIHVDVTFKKLAYFRRFLHSITHHYRGLTPGLKVRTINLDIDYLAEENQNQMMVFTEFELLARHCPNVTELKFDNPEYWIFLLDLDYTRYWKHLKKLPDIDGGVVSRTVVLLIGKRLENYGIDTTITRPSILTHDVIKENVYEDLELCGDLKSIKIKSNSYQLLLSDVIRIINENKYLEDIMFSIRIEKDSPFTEKEDSRTAVAVEHLQSLRCLIHHQEHPILEYIRHHVKNLKKITFDIEAPRVLADDGIETTIAEITRAVILDEILDLFYCPADKEKKKQADYRLITKQMRINIGETSPVFLDNLFTSLVCMTSHLYETYSTYASVHINFAQDTNNSIFSYSDTTFLPSRAVHHEFNVTYPYDSELESAIAFTDIQRASDPIISFIKQVTIEQARQDHQVKPAQFHCIDLIIQHFKKAHTINFIANEVPLLPKYPKLPSHYILDCQSGVSGPPHLSLKNLSVKGGILSALSIAYLFRRCPNLSFLEIERQKYDKHSLLIIEYICLSRNIRLKQL